MEETSAITGEDIFQNSLPASPNKSSIQTENVLAIASPMKSPEKLRILRKM